MSYVTNYFIIGWDEEGLKKLEGAFKKFSNSQNFELKAIDLGDAAGPKHIEAELYAYAGNYFDDDGFEEWLAGQTFEFQILRKKQNDDKFTEIYFKGWRG